VQGATSNGPLEKSLEEYLSEAETCTQYGMIEKAIDQLKTASKQFPSSVALHRKLKNLYSQQGLTNKVIEECSILARLYQEMGEEAKRQTMLDELMTLKAHEDKSASPSTETDDLPLDPLDEEESFQIDLSDLELPSTQEEDTILSYGDNDALTDQLRFEGEIEKVMPEEEAFLAGKETSLHFDADAYLAETDANEKMDSGKNSFYLEDVDTQDLEKNLSVSASYPDDDTYVSPDNLLQTEADIDLEKENDLESESFSIDLEASSLNAAEEAELESTLEDLHQGAVNDPMIDSISASLEKTNTPTTSLEENKTEEEYVDLQAILSEDLKNEKNETTLDKTSRYFQNKTQEDDKLQEIETQYDLGIAYKEMDMIPEAIKAFKSASLGENRFKDAMTMLASCHLNNVTIDAAVDTLQNALAHRQASEQDTMSLKYELALLHEEQGNQKKARFLFAEVFKIDPTFRDVASKRSASIENELGTSWDTPPEKGTAKGNGKTKKKDRVSYL